MAYILDSILVKKFGGSVSSDEIGSPGKSSRMALPCGSTAIWQIPYVWRRFGLSDESII